MKPQIVLDVALLATHGDQPLAPLSRPVPARAPPFVEVPSIAGRERHLLAAGQDARSWVGRVEDLEAEADEFVLGEPGLPANGRVDVVDATEGVQRDRGEIVDAVDQRGEPGFRLLEASLLRDLHRHVAQRRDVAIVAQLDERA